jgi:acetyl esterase/lipase
MTRSEFLFHVIDKALHHIQNYRRFKNIIKEPEFVYDENNPDDCTAEFFYDTELMKTKKLPVLINIHGGGFVKGDKKHRASVSGVYADKGFFVLNVNYRLSPKSRFPAGVQDCVKALNYLLTVKDKYNIDLDKVVLTGDSAGAYYATMLVAVAHDETLRNAIKCDEVKIKPACLLSCCGVYDLVASITLTKVPFNLVWDMGHCLLDNDTFKLKRDFSNMNEYEHIKDISPINWVNENWCPSFLVMSKQDVFCKGQGELLEQKLKDANVPVDTYKSEKFLDNHCFHLDMYKAISRECFEKIFAFLEKTLG